MVLLIPPASTVMRETGEADVVLLRRGPLGGGLYRARPRLVVAVTSVSDEDVRRGMGEDGAAEARAARVGRRLRELYGGPAGEAAGGVVVPATGPRRRRRRRT